LRWTAAIPARSFAVANRATGVVAATDEEDRPRIVVFRNGEQVIEYRLDGNSRNVAVSPNGEFVLATDTTTAHMLTPASGRALWQMKLPEAGYSIRSIAVSNAGLALIGAQHESGQNGMVAVVEGGRVLYRQDLPLQRSNAWIPTVQLGPEGDSALLRSLEELILIDLR
jgi:outer membrane protein assembly factor BamB